MNILVCSDGSEQADSALRFAVTIAGGTKAAVTLLGVVEQSGDEAPLLDALRRSMQFAKDKNVEVGLVTKNGEPVGEIQRHAAEKPYDLVLIGATYKGHAGPYVMSIKAYKLIKVIAAPVLVVTGRRPQLKRVLICAGGGSYINKAIELTGQIAHAMDATVTLFHVLPSAPAMYGGIMGDEEDVESLLASKSQLGLNLRREKETLEGLGVRTELKVRHGDVALRILSEIGEGDYDLIVAGSSPAGGAFRTYLMGDVTSEIVNRAQRPVLVVRAEKKPAGHGGFFGFLRRFRRS